MNGIEQRLLATLLVSLFLSIALPGLVYGAEAPALNANAPGAAKTIAVITGAKASAPELKAAEIMSKRLIKRSGVTVNTITESAPAPAADLTFVVGTTAGNALVKTLLQDFGAKLPTLPNSDKVHPEGFAVKSGALGGRSVVVIAGVDGPGTIYGAGWMLRNLTYLPGSVQFHRVDVTDKPAFWMRAGNPSGPGSRAREFGNLRPQTHDETVETMEDQMLLGTNIFYGDPKAMRENYGMMATYGRTANEMPEGFPKEWAADNGRAKRYVCPSIPEAHKALLESFDTFFKEAPDYDFFTTNSGDEGGCTCDKCKPWGGTYIKLVHEIAGILHKYHPNTNVLATNQDLSNDGNQAIFKYLNSADSSWLYAVRYGPGADEMQTYIRGPVNPRWFEYEGFGPLGNYLKYMYHELPRTTNIALYTDITHWMQSQFAVQHPDVALAALYDRRSWNARPNNFHKVAQEIFHYAVGDIHYSEGMHDDFNKWFWYRLMWNPNQTAEALTSEYCQYWFGPEAENEMAQVIFLMEKTLEKPVLGNPGIGQAVDLAHSAGKKIPKNLLRNDWRWRVISEKALMDRYLQMELERGDALKTDAGHALTGAASAPQAALEKALKAIDQPIETDAMKAIRDEAKQRGEECNAAIGYREPACFIVDKYDFTEVAWWKKTIQDALATANDARMRNAANMILHYDDPGEGGFYDDLGWPNESKHLTRGDALWGFRPLAGPARLSHYNLAYQFGGKEGGVAFSYDGLDPKAQYVARISVGGKSVELEERDMKLSEGITADGVSLGAPFAVPTEQAGLFEFDIPQNLTGDGAVKIELTPGSDGLPITAAAEIWLMRRDKMPWTARP
ncbi:MAG: hypothetical protein HZB26_20645 [Candidatus Hydrogenedentes bacterium]|nr:hypothetical protein [Candidatus Hydrogenedentota bacterium]